MNAKCDPRAAQMIHSHVERLSTLCDSSTECQELNRLDNLVVAARSLACNESNVAARHASRRRFSPSLAYGRHFCPPLPTARRAAVMILFEPRDGHWSIPLTVRPQHLPDHPGQVCLPGGRMEAGETVVQAAEREFCEELGFERFPTQTLTELQSVYVFNSDFYLTPCLAAVDHKLVYDPNPTEVEAILHLPVEHLLDLDRHVVRAHARGSVSWTALGIEFEGLHIWGATAMVLGELAAILQADPQFFPGVHQPSIDRN